MGGQRPERWGLGLHHGRIERLIKPRRLIRELPELLRSIGACKCRHSLSTPVGIIEQIQRRPVPPPMSCQQGVAVQTNVIFQAFTHIGKQCLKHRTHRQNGWPDIHGTGHGRRSAHFTAGPVRHLHDMHIQSLRCQSHRSGKPANSGAYDNGLGQSFTFQVSAYVDTSL